MRIFSPAIAPSLPYPLSPLLPGSLLLAKCRGSATPGTSHLLLDLDDPAGANGPAAFANGEAQALLHGDRLDQLDLHLGVVAGQHHLSAFRQLHHAGHVRGPEVELRTVVVEERRVPTALVLGQDVHLRLELGVRGVGARLDDDLAALDLVALGAAKEQAGVVARLAF